GPRGGARGRPLPAAASLARARDRRGRRAKARQVRRALPAKWCGDIRATDDLEHERDTGGARYHAVYLVPADRPQRLHKLAATLQRDAMQASALLEASYGRAIRFDMGTRCGPQYLDISVVRMPETVAALAALASTETGTIDAVTRALRAHGFDASDGSDDWDLAAPRMRNFLGWLDGPGPHGACGQATLYGDSIRDQSNANNQGGRVALAFRAGRSFCGSNTVRHEIAHNLGALQQRAPHAFDGAHCDDAYEDTMCYSRAPRRSSGHYQSLFFDYGNDDYWDPPGGAPLPWWTVNLSRFVCPTPACNAPTAGPPPDASSRPGKSRRRGSPGRRSRARRS
nr:hypothetical protein [Actinomycetota bacterium]